MAYEDIRCFQPCRNSSDRLADRTVDIEVGYINLSARVSPSFPKTTSTMHAITSLVAIFGAGRQSKSTHTTHIDTTDAIIGLPGVECPEDIMMPVALHSLVQEIKALEDKEAIAHPVASEEGHKVGWPALPSVLKKWKVRVAKKIFKQTVSPVPDPEAKYINKLVALHRAAYLATYREENETARLELRTLLNYSWEDSARDSMRCFPLHFNASPWHGYRKSRATYGRSFSRGKLGWSPKRLAR